MMAKKRRGRGQGEGSIFKRKDGRWVGTISLGWRDGRRRRKSVYGAKRGQVQKQLNAALRAHQQGFNVAPEKQTVAQFLARWLKDCVEPSTRLRTAESYRTAVRLHIAPVLGKIPLPQLRPEHVQSLMTEKLAPQTCSVCSGSGKVTGKSEQRVACRSCRGKGTILLSARSVEYIHSVLSRALNRAVKWDLLPRNVCILVPTPRVPRQRVEPLSPDDAIRFLAAIKGDANEALYSVAMALGLRKGEALGLRWQDIDLETATLSVRHQLQSLHGKKLTELKSERSCRTLPLPEFAVRSLRTHRRRQLQQRLLAGTTWKDTGHVFTTAVGTPMDSSRVSKLFRKALSEAELPHKRFHDLRHTAASLLLAQGVHARVVMETLGHSQISVTMNTYTHVMPTLLQDAASKMNALLSR